MQTAANCQSDIIKLALGLPSNVGHFVARVTFGDGTYGLFSGLFASEPSWCQNSDSLILEQHLILRPTAAINWA